jgi:hypothetical protein
MATEKSSTRTRTRKTSAVRKFKREPHPLPFVQDSPEGMRSHWVVNPSGDYSLDCDLGRQYAYQTLEYMRTNDMTPLLFWIVRDMPKSYSGIEVTFFATISHAAAFPFSSQRAA